MTSEIDRLLGELDNETKQAIEHIIEEAGTSDADWAYILASGQVLAKMRKKHKKVMKEKEHRDYQGMIGNSSNKAMKSIQRLVFNGKKDPEYALERIAFLESTLEFERTILIEIIKDS